MLCRACAIARGALRPATRAFSSSAPAAAAAAAAPEPGAGLKEFWDGHARLHGRPQPCGRAWRAAELRRKSFDDLHGLWYVCLKERNMLLTERYAAHKAGRDFLGPDRLDKVKQTMARIKGVVHERRLAADVHARNQRETLHEAHRIERAEARVAAGLDGGAGAAGAAGEGGDTEEAAAARVAAAAKPVPRPTFRQQMRVATRRFQKQDRLRRGGQFRYGKDEARSVPTYEELVLAKAGVKLPVDK